MFDELFAGGVIAAGLACYQDVEVAYSFAATAQRAGWGYFFYSGIVAKVLDDFIGLSFAGIEQEAPGDAAILFDGLEQFLLLLLPHARKLAYLSLARVWPRLPNHSLGRRSR